MGLVPAGYFCKFSVAHNCGAGAACVRAHASSNVAPGKKNAHTAAPSASAIVTVALGATHKVVARSRALGFARADAPSWRVAISLKPAYVSSGSGSKPWRYAIE